MDYKLIDNIEVDGIDTKDYPDFCDAQPMKLLRK